MTLRNLLLNSVATWLFLADPVQAAPVAAAFAVIAKGGIAAALFKGALAIGAQLGMSLYQRAKAKKAQKNQQPRGVNVSVKTGDDNAIEFPIGKSSTPGIRTYAGSWGEASKTPNAYFTDVLEISYLPAGLASMWAGEKKCTILWNEPHPSGWGCPVQEFRVGGVDYMWVKFADGMQTIADPFLRATFGTHPTWPYKETMIGRGVAYAAVTTRFNQDLFPSGKPEYLFEPTPTVFYDLRKDSTAGGNGPHRWNDRSTWEPTENNAVIIYNIIRGIYYGTEWVYGGRNLSAFRLPASNWIAAANECDRLIALKDGTSEKQFRCGMQVTGDMEPLDLIEELLKGCSGRLSECGGVFYLLIGAPGASVYSFSDDQVVRTAEEELDPFPAPTEINNGIEATFPQPAERWVMRDAPARYDAALEASDDGHRRVSSVQFRATPYAVTVQRLMEAMLKDGRRFAVHTLSLPPETKPLLPNNVIAWTSARNGYTNKKFQILAKTGAQGFRQQVVVKEIDPADHGWSTDREIPVSIGHVGPTPIPPQPMYGWNALPDHVADATGAARRPAIRISCAPDQDDVQKVQVWVRVKATGAMVFDSDATPYAAPHSWLLSGAWCLPNTLYQVRGQYLPYSRRPTEPSEWMDVLTPNVLLGDGDVYLPNMVKDLQKFVGDVTEFTRDSSRQLMLEQQRLARLTAETDVAAYTDRQKMRRELLSTTNAVTARYLEEIEAATGPNSSLARRTQTLEAVIPTLVTSITYSSLVARVTSTEAGLTSQGLALTQVQGELPNKASASALSSLGQTVTLLNGRVNSQADALTSISAGTTPGDFTTANFRMRSIAGPAGFSSTIAMEARSVVGGVDWKSAGFYIDVPPVGQSRFGVVVDQFFISSGAGDTKPFVFENGKLTLALAAIKLIQSGRMESLNGKMKINLDLGTIEIFS